MHAHGEHSDTLCERAGAQLSWGLEHLLPGQSSTQWGTMHMEFACMTPPWLVCLHLKWSLHLHPACCVGPEEVEHVKVLLKKLLQTVAAEKYRWWRV